jgi:hypothetical protein
MGLFRLRGIVGRRLGGRFSAGEERFDPAPEDGDAADAGGQDDLDQDAAAAGSM